MIAPSDRRSERSGAPWLALALVVVAVLWLSALVYWAGACARWVGAA